ncbi:MAG: hypothetical protein KKB50_00670 [Planctomycetes bacterium]|nr:hypothetical protein [Planctomycetota bacterium]
MYRAIPVALTLSTLFGVGAAAQVPPKYEIVQITDNPHYEPVPRINNHGQCVFMVWFDTSDRRTEEIFLYDNGVLTRLTDDYIQDCSPDINDDGTIVWCRGLGPINPQTGEPTLEIVLYENGQITRLTDNDRQDHSPAINNSGHVVWARDMGQICGTHEAMDLFLYDGQEILQITTDGLSEEVANQAADINDYDDIVWTRYNFCADPWESAIMMYSNAVTTQISPVGTLTPRGVTINNGQQVAWLFQIGGGQHGIHLWENGVTTLFTDWGGGPRLNDNGDMCFFRWYENESTYQMWLYRKGWFYQLSDDPFWNASGDINDRGEVVWQSGDYPWSDIRLMRRKQPGGQNGAAKKMALTAQPVSP